MIDAEKINIEVKRLHDKVNRAFSEKFAQMKVARALPDIRKTKHLEKLAESRFGNEIRSITIEAEKVAKKFGIDAGYFSMCAIIGKEWVDGGCCVS